MTTDRDAEQVGTSAPCASEPVAWTGNGSLNRIRGKGADQWGYIYGSRDDAHPIALIPASDLEQVTRERDGLRGALSIISGLSSAGNFSITHDAGRGLLQRIEEIADTALNNLDNRND